MTLRAIPVSSPSDDGGALGLSNLIQELTAEALVYVTPAIFARRRRILEVARALIQERGYADFTVREVCERAKVSTHTLYRAFESRERLIAVAIAVYVRDFHARVTSAFPGATLEDAVCRLVLSGRTMLANPRLSKALIAIHYSPTADETLQRVAGEKGRIIHADWVHALFHAGQLRRGLTPARLVDDLTTILFSVCWEWARGRVDDADFLAAQLKVMLTYATGATRGAAQTQTSALLADLLGSGTQIAALEDRATSRAPIDEEQPDQTA